MLTNLFFSERGLDHIRSEVPFQTFNSLLISLSTQCKWYGWYGSMEKIRDDEDVGNVHLITGEENEGGGGN